MTLPSSGSLSLNDIHVEINGGGASGTVINMVYVYDRTKPGQRSYAMSNYYGKSYYQRNTDGNCNNENCACNCNCYLYPNNCVNCNVCDNINCANCDTQLWLQNGTNCACTYNCYNSQCVQYNCDNCACQCK